MNDRYLFKAKRIDNGEWVQGALLDGENHCLIGQEIRFSPYVDNECKIVGHEVDRNTICACTGLYDKEKRLIWENDLVYARCNGLSGKGVVKYENGCFVLKDRKRNRTYSLFGEWKFRVDGSIFDNPELLEE